MADETGELAQSTSEESSTASAPYDPMPDVQSHGESMAFPGVFRDGEDGPVAEKEAKPAEAGQEAKPGEEPKPEAEPNVAVKPTPGIQPDGKVFLGGREFRDVNHANQAMSTVFGMFKAGQTKTTEAAARADHNLRAATAWQAEAERLRAQLESGAAPAKGAPTAPQPEAQADAPEIDWELHQAILEDHGPARAQRWLHEQNLKVVEAQVAKQVGAVRGEVEERFQPFAEQEAQVSHAREVQTLFQRVQTYQYPDGTKAYPELEYDEHGTKEKQAEQLAAISEIGEILRTYVPESQRVTDQGMHMAVLIYRDTQARTNAALKAFAPSVTTTAVIPKNPSAAAVGDSSAAPVIRPQGGPMRRDQQILAEMEQAGKTVRNWGFAE